MELLWPPWARPVLLFVLLSLVFAWVAYRRMRPYRLLRRTLSAGGQRGKQIPVGYLSQEDLAGGHVGRQFAKPAMLVTGNNGELDVYVLTRGSACLRYRLPSADTGFDWFRS
ncbi:MAG: hypothetical protein HKP57_07770, partial [Halobacteria archaeon]|nr:hypothetical protein [Halobacteria archaeon]